MPRIIIARQNPDLIDFSLRPIDFPKNGRMPFPEVGGYINLFAIVALKSLVPSDQAHVKKIGSGPQPAKARVIEMIEPHPSGIVMPKHVRGAILHPGIVAKLDCES